MKLETKELLQSLLGAARSSEPARHAIVLEQLQDPNVLYTLDSQQEYDAGQFRLRASQVVEALARNPAPSARATFVALLTSDVFLDHDDRIVALISSSVHLRPAPRELAEFWDRYSQPDDGFTPVTVTVLVDNGSPPAIEVLKRKLVEPTHDDDSKITWMRTRILPHRNDVPLLMACDQLLAKELPEHLQPSLVEVLFDFRPEDWFRPAADASPPPLEQASDEALDQLLKVGETALTMVRLTGEQRSVVLMRLEHAKRLREDRGKPV